MSITVYSKPACVQCTATTRALQAHGLDFNVVDLTEDEGADACREDEHPAHLHDRQHPVEPVVNIERGREPREVHPRPPDREEHEQVLSQPLAEVARRDRVPQVRRGDRDSDDEHEVEEQFE